MNIYCYFCGDYGTTYVLPYSPLSSVSSLPLLFSGLSLTYTCHKCEEELALLPISYFGTAYTSILAFEFCQVAIKNWTISLDIKEMTLTHWTTSLYMFKELPKSPFSQAKLSRVPLSYLKKRFSILEPFT